MNTRTACEWHVGVCFAFKYSINRQWNEWRIYMYTNVREAWRTKKRREMPFPKYLFTVAVIVVTIYCLNTHFHKCISMQCSAMVLEYRPKFQAHAYAICANYTLWKHKKTMEISDKNERRSKWTAEKLEWKRKGKWWNRERVILTYFTQKKESPMLLLLLLQHYNILKWNPSAALSV